MKQAKSIPSPSDKRKNWLRGSATGLVMSGLLACAPVIDNRGYVFDESLLPQLVVGTTSEADIITIMGSPSTVSTLNGGAYYYISSRFITEAYRAPRETERRVLAIFLDEDKKIRDLGFYTLEDGNIVTIVARTTETQGRELTFLQQIFGNLGRFESGDGSNF
jgi:outer membrane protein assembly factor BamE (lipoprotein component of BamABCDE complex)